MTKKHCTTFSELKRKVLANPVAMAAYREARRSWKFCDLQIDEHQCVELEFPVDTGKKETIEQKISKDKIRSFLYTEITIQKDPKRK